MSASSGFTCFITNAPTIGAVTGLAPYPEVSAAFIRSPVVLVVYILAVSLVNLAFLLQLPSGLIPLGASLDLLRLTLIILVLGFVVSFFSHTVPASLCL